MVLQVIRMEFLTLELVMVIKKMHTMEFPVIIMVF